MRGDEFDRRDREGRRSLESLYPMTAADVRRYDVAERVPPADPETPRALICEDDFVLSTEVPAEWLAAGPDGFVPLEDCA